MVPNIPDWACSAVLGFPVMKGNVCTIGEKLCCNGSRCSKVPMCVGAIKPEAQAGTKGSDQTGLLMKFCWPSVWNILPSWANGAWFSIIEEMGEAAGDVSTAGSRDELLTCVGVAVESEIMVLLAFCDLLSFIEAFCSENKGKQLWLVLKLGNVVYVDKSEIYWCLAPYFNNNYQKN